MKFGIRALSWGLCLAPLFAQAADGLSVTDSPWPSWQARLSVNATTPVLGTEIHGRMFTTSVFGDYYFGVPHLLPLSPEGGLRATSGMIASSGLRLPQASTAAFTESADKMPYVGLGYTHSALHGGWGFTADVGLVAENPAGAMRLGRAVLGNGPALDDAVRNMKLAPMVQLGVRYTF